MPRPCRRPSSGSRSTRPMPCRGMPKPPPPPKRLEKDGTPLLQYLTAPPNRPWRDRKDPEICCPSTGFASVAKIPEPSNATEQRQCSSDSFSGTTMRALGRKTLALTTTERDRSRCLAMRSAEHALPVRSRGLKCSPAGRGLGSAGLPLSSSLSLDHFGRGTPAPPPNVSCLTNLLCGKQDPTSTASPEAPNQDIPSMRIGTARARI